MRIYRDQRSLRLNAWAAQHAKERPSQPFPREADAFWADFDEWIFQFSYWAVRCDYVSLDPLELAERIRERVLAHSQTFQGNAHFTTWLYRIGFHEMWAMLRPKKNKNTTYLEDEPPGRIDEALLAQSSGTDFLADDPKSLLATLLAQLRNPRDAKILILSRIEGMGDEEIAGLMGLKRSNVHSIVQRTMKRLRLIGQQDKGDRGKHKPGLQRARAKRAAS